GGRGLRPRVDPRQVDLEGRPLPRLAVDPDVAATLLHDPVDGAEAEPGPLPLLLRGEERLEDSLPRALVHPGTGVADDEDDVGAGLERGEAPGVVLSELDVPRL